MTPTNLLAYNVDDNIDLFYNDVKEGINTILIGMFNKFELPLVVLGCNGSFTCNLLNRMKFFNRKSFTSLR